MKKIFTLATISLLLMSCDLESECNQYCGVIVDVHVNNNLPYNGDETYEITIKNECDGFETVWIPFNVNYGYPGSPNQPLQRVFVGDQYCIR
jgi:hypothetical protein